MIGLIRNNSARSSPYRARTISVLLFWAALLGGSAAYFAAGPAPQGLAATEEKPHEPLTGKSCVECHKKGVAPEVRCLVAEDPMCVLCHEIPFAGGHVQTAEDYNQLCFKCHEENAYQGSFVHGPFDVGACLACHDPHNGKAPGMVWNTGRPMCIACHTDVNSQFENLGFRHKAAMENCTNCHSPHASDQSYGLRSAIPELCAKCHEDILGEQQTVKVQHSPVTEEASCLNCHDPHASEENWLLVADGIDICMQCHDEPIEMDQYELKPMGQLLMENPYHHGPIQSRECSGCHNPHGSAYFRILTDPYPEENYAPFFESSYGLCFRCHDSTLAIEASTTNLTEFRDGDRNLHYVHVNKTEMGRTCRLCHEAHASASSKYIPASVPFGTWDLPIKFTETDSGGSCEPGCHAEQSYEHAASQSSQ